MDALRSLAARPSEQSTSFLQCAAARCLDAALRVPGGLLLPVIIRTFSDLSMATRSPVSPHEAPCRCYGKASSARRSMATLERGLAIEPRC